MTDLNDIDSSLSDANEIEESETFGRRQYDRERRRFPLKLTIDAHVYEASSTEVNFYGAMVKISKELFSVLENIDLSLEKEIFVKSPLDDFKAFINNVFTKDGEFYLSFKLNEKREWYQKLI